MNAVAVRLDRAVGSKGVDIVYDDRGDGMLSQRTLASDEDLELVYLVEVRFDNRIGPLLDEEAGRTLLHIASADVGRAVIGNRPCHWRARDAFALTPSPARCYQCHPQL